MAEARPKEEQSGQAASRRDPQDMRLHRAAQEAPQQTLELGIETFEHNLRTVQDIWRAGLDAARDITERSADEMARTFFAADGARASAEQSTRNIEAVVSSAGVIAQRMQDISREWFDFSRARMEHQLRHMSRMLQCRTPQDLMAAHSELWRDHMEGIVQSGRKLGELSTRIAEESGRKINEKVRQAA